MNEPPTNKPPLSAATANNSPSAATKEMETPSVAEKAQLENRELLQTLQRVQADFENFQKRSTKEKEQSVQFGKALAFKEILEFLDSFDAALVHVNDDHRKGLENLRTQLLKILERNGIQLLVTLGKRFNPELQECLMQGNDPMQAEDIVLEEFQKGYMFNGLVLRTAKVKVNAHAAKENQKQNDYASQDATKNQGGN